MLLQIRAEFSNIRECLISESNKIIAQGQQFWGTVAGGSLHFTGSVTRTLDSIIDTVFGNHLIAPLLSAVKPQGKFIFLGEPEKPLEVQTFSLIMVKPLGKFIILGEPEKPLEAQTFSLIMGKKTFAGSAIGGVKETQEMLGFAAEHRITADI